MILKEDIDNPIENIISSYEAKIRSIGAIFDTSHQLLKSFQTSFLDTRLQRERLNSELQENLAKNESLRKRDFDNMMQDILSTQDEREKQVRDLLNNYLDEQKKVADILRSILAKVKDALAQGQAERIKELYGTINEVLAKQEERKRKAIFKLEEFQQGQLYMLTGLRQLLNKGSEIKIKDLKSMLAAFKPRHKERAIPPKKEIETTQGTPSYVDGDRLDMAEGWQTMQEKMTEGIITSSAAVNVGA
jgi:Rad3-related DNA helicase